MARPLRLEAPGEFFHVLSRGNDRRPIYSDDGDRLTFLDALAEACDRFAVACHAYCLMGNHYHLLVQPQDSNLSSALHRLNGTFARRLNVRHRRTGHLFEGRFKSLLIERDAYLLAVARSIVLNPVRAGIVDDARAWPWSSYRATAGLARAPRFLTTSLVLDAVHGEESGNAHASYIDFVRASVGEHPDDSSMDRAVEAGGILGSGTFRRQFAREIRAAKDQRGVVRSHRFAARPRLGDLLENPSGGGIADRMRLAFAEHGYRLAEIAEAAGVGVSTVQRAVRSGGVDGGDSAEDHSV